MIEWLRIHYPGMVKEQEDRLKKCHACGQKLPLKVGDVVEGTLGAFGKKIQGLVVNLSDLYVVVTRFNTGVQETLSRRQCVRLHGYYRITEREPLS